MQMAPIITTPVPVASTCSNENELFPDGWTPLTPVPVSDSSYDVTEHQRKFPDDTTVDGDALELESDKLMQVIRFTAACFADATRRESPEQDSPAADDASSSCRIECPRPEKRSRKAIAGTPPLRIPASCCDECWDGTQTQRHECRRHTPLSSEDVLDGPKLTTICDESGLDQQLAFQTNLPFNEKSPEERDQVIKQIAKQLDEISERIMKDFDRPRAMTVEEFLGRAVSYDSFAAAVSEAVGSTDSGVRDLALFTRLISHVISASDSGQNVIEWTKRYFREKLAPFVIRSNGLESLVRQTSVGENGVDSY